MAASTRKVGKTKGEWQCGTCFSVETRLRKMLGCWPIEDAADIPAEKQIEFYNAAAVSNGGHKLKLCLKEALVKNIIRQIIDKDQTEWLPESVWLSRGWAEKSDPSPPVQGG